jgi:glycosyltransferase involved in cell wall biosynthesis
MKVCVVIPTYNEAHSITGLIQQLRRQNLEILVVDDGSRDNTSRLALSAGAKVIRNEINSGKGRSLRKGFAYALKNGFDAVITMDGDGQHLPEDIPLFMRLAGSCDKAIFVGNRMHKIKGMPWMRVFTNKFMSWLISCLVKQEIPDTQCGFRLIKRELLERLNLRTYKYETESEVLIKAARLGFTVKSIPVSTVYSNGRSRIHPVMDTLRFFRFIAQELWTTRY